MPGIVGFGKAAQLAAAALASEPARPSELKEHFVATLQWQVNGLSINGHPTQTLPGCVNLRIEGIAAMRMMKMLQDTVAVSSGSACTSTDQAPSHVLSAIGLGDEEARCSLHIGLGRYTTLAEVDAAIEHFCHAIEQISRHQTVAAA